MKKLILFFGFLLFYCSTFAQYDKPLTLDDCIRNGIQNSKTLRISKSKIQGAESKLKEVNSSRLPSVKFTGSYTRLSEVEPFSIEFNGRLMTISQVLLNSYQMRLTLQQPVFTGFRLQNTADMSEYNLLASEEDFVKDQKILIFDIKNAFWQLFSIKESLKSMDESINQMKAHIADLENMFKAGLATSNDLLKTKLQLSNLELSRIDIDNGLQTTRMVLNNLIGFPVYNNTEIESKLNYNETQMQTREELLKNAFMERNDLKAMELRIKAGESAVQIAKSGWYPQLFFGGNYLMANPNSRIMPTRNEFIGTWDMGLTLSMDIWNWRTYSHQTHQAEAQLEQTKFALDQIKDGISLEVAQNEMAIRKLKEKIEHLNRTIEQAEENFRVTNEKFKSGIVINSELLDAETALLVSKINYTTALAEYQIALAKLEKSLGK